MARGNRCQILARFRCLKLLCQRLPTDFPRFVVRVSCNWASEEGVPVLYGSSAAECVGVADSACHTGYSRSAIVRQQTRSAEVTSVAVARAPHAAA